MLRHRNGEGGRGGGGLSVSQRISASLRLLKVLLRQPASALGTLIALFFLFLALLILLFCLGTLLTFFSFSFAAQSLLAGMSASQFISNLFFARWLLGEPLHKKNILGTCILMAGMVLIVLGSERSEISNDIDAFFKNFYFTIVPHVTYIIGLVSLALFFCFLFWFRTGVLPFWRKKGD